MKQFIKENKVLVGAFLLLLIGFIIATIYRWKYAKPEISYTRYNDKNFPNLVSRSNMPRDTGNPIADIQLIRMAENDPKLAATIQS